MIVTKVITYQFTCAKCGKIQGINWCDNNVKTKQEAIKVIKGGWYNWTITKGSCYCDECSKEKEYV